MLRTLSDRGVIHAISDEDAVQHEETVICGVEEGEHRYTAIDSSCVYVNFVMWGPNQCIR